MSVAYVGLNIKDFIANTVRLNTEAKGAYLMLLLDYYEQQEGPPADPDVLATVTGLPLETWERHARVILPLFEIRDGRLYQQRVEDELEKARRRISLASFAGNAAKAARESRKKDRQNLPPNNVRTEVKVQPEVLTEPPTAPPTERNGQKTTVEQFSENFPQNSATEFQYTSTIKKEGIEADASIPTAREGWPAEGGETLLDPDFSLTAADVIRCQNDGATTEQITAVFDGWKLRMIAAGTFSNDWPAVWWRRWERDKPVKPKPRIEVSNKKPKAKGFPLPEDWEPNDLHRQRAQERGIIGRDFDDLVETFRDYCNQAANRTKYSDHDGAFRTFIKNQNTFNRGSNGTTQATRRAPPPSRGSIVGAADEAIANLEREIAGGDEGD